MEIRKALFRKEMKLVTLLLTSLLIASASASIYYSISLQSTTTVGAPVVKFVTASDFPTGSNLTDSWVRLKLKSYPNATLTYERAVNISNTGGSDKTFRLTPSTPTGDSSSNWDYIKFIVYNNAIPGVVQGSLNYTGGGSWGNTGQTGLMTIGTGVQWTIRVITRSPSTANLNAVCNIVISVDVTE